MRGKAAPTDLRSDVDGDHPRTCGEKAMYEYGNNTAEGSPPHVRGKEVDTVTETAVTGITPACAGKRRCKAAFCVWSWDHPRMCGEKWAVRFCSVSDMGSPPHVRGKGILHPMHCPHGRITPACAGKSNSSLVVQSSLWDHPRMCGEKVCFFFVCFFEEGSPPHVRGKASCPRKAGIYPRITPACAGKRRCPCFRP